VPVDAFVISDLDPDGRGTRDYFDPQTLLKVRHERINASGTIVTTYSAFQHFGTQVLPSTWRIEFPEKGSSPATSSRAQFVVGETTERDVAIPPVRTFVHVPPGTSIDIHADFEPDTNRVNVPVNIGGKTLTFRLDMANSGIGIDAGSAQDLGLARIDQPKSPISRGALVAVPDLDVAGVHFRNIVAWTGNYGRGASVVGSLGFDFFAELAVHVDFRHKHVTIYYPISFQPPSGKNVSPLALQLGDESTVTTASFNGVTASHVGLSLYTNSVILVSQQFARRNPSLLRRIQTGADLTTLAEGAATATYTTPGDQRYFDAHTYRIDDFRLGRFAFHGIDMHIMAGPDLLGDAEDAIVGTDFLSAFTIDCDIPGGFLYLTTDAPVR
jgi:hypothetical protein